MRVISPRALRNFWEKRPEAKPPLRAWLKIAEKARWTSITDVRRDFPHADPVRLANGQTATIFNAGGNKFRIACSIQYPVGRVYIRGVMTHAEYDTNAWHRDF